MRRVKSFLPWMLTLCLALAGAAQASASTFARVDLDYLVAENGLILVGEVLSSRSYRNETGTLILTDVQVSVSEVLKGRWENHEITVTLPGGTIGDETIAVIGGGELLPGRSYVLFLRKGDLPGASGVHIVRDHSQGLFEIRMAADGLRTVSQAAQLDLVPDALGNAQAVGGAQGMPFQALRQSVRDLAERGRRQEVK